MALSSAGMAASIARPSADPLGAQDAGKPNILIFVLDALSARNMSLYGYQRETTPNLAKLVERAVVYHNHYAGDTAHKNKGYTPAIG